MVIDAHGAASSARVVAKGVTVRALAANAFFRPPQSGSFSAAVAAKSQSPSLLLTAPSEPNRVQQIVEGLAATAGGYATFAGTGAAGSLGDGGAASAAQFDLKIDSFIERSGVAIAVDGTVFIADTGNRTIRRIAPATSTEPGVVRSVAGRFAPAQNVDLSEPLGIAIDRQGNLYIADRGENAVLVLHDATAETPGTLEIVAHVAAPSSVAVTQDGTKVFVSTTTTGAVFSIDSVKKNIAAVKGFSGAPNACGTAASATGTAATLSTTVCPAALAVDPRGNLYISDANSGRLLRVNAADEKTVTVAENLRTPGAIASDTKGNLYVADQSRAEIVFVPAASTQTCVTSSSGALQLCPASNDFGSVVQGGTTASVPFVLTNTTADSLAGLTYSPALPSTNPPVQPPSSPYIVQNTSCLTSLPANGSCTLGVTFSPNATGAISGTLTVGDSNPQDTVNSSLSGSGTNFQLQLASGQSQTITVVAGDTAKYSFTLIPDTTNPYVGPVTIVCPPNASTPTSDTLPLLAYCVVPSSPVTITAGQSTNFSVSIETTSRSGITSSSQLLPFWWPGDKPVWPSAGSVAAGAGGGHFAARVIAPILVVLAAVLLALLFARRRGLRAAFAVLALLALGAAIAGCGGHKLTVDGTPAGTSNLLFQATAQGTGRALTVQLIVQ